MQKGNKGFYFVPDNISMVPRAQVQITDACPDYIRQMLIYAIAEGHIRAVANVPERDLVWDALAQQPNTD